MQFPKQPYTSQRRKRAASRIKAPVTPEKAIQKACEQYLDLMQITYIRIPDEVYRVIFGYSFIPIWVKKIIAAFLKGLPDITLLFKTGRYHCFELKTAKGKLSQGQKSFCVGVGVQNYTVVRSVEEFIDKIKHLQRGE